MFTSEKETPTKKAAAPSVSQINAEYVTQVIIPRMSTSTTLCAADSFVVRISYSEYSF